MPIVGVRATCIEREPITAHRTQLRDPHVLRPVEGSGAAGGRGRFGPVTTKGAPLEAALPSSLNRLEDQHRDDRGQHQPGDHGDEALSGKVYHRHPGEPGHCDE